MCRKLLDRVDEHFDEGFTLAWEFWSGLVYALVWFVAGTVLLPVYLVRRAWRYRKKP